MKQKLKTLLLSNYISIFGTSLFAPLYSLFVLEIGGNAFHAGASWAVYTLVSGILLFMFGRIEDTVSSNKEKMVVIGYFVLAFTNIMMIFVSIPAHIYVVQVFNAIGVSILNPAWKALYGKNEDKGKEAQQWALFDGGDRIMIAIASFLGGIIITYYNFLFLFIIIFIIQLGAALESLKLLRK